MTRKHIFALVLSLILSVLGASTLAANFPPPAAAQAQPTAWHALTDVLPAYTSLYNVTISPDSYYAIFTADIDVDEQIELYSVPITGTLPVKLNPPLVSDGRVFDFIITPDSSRVIYRAEQEVDERVELYSVPIAGGPATKLNGLLAPGGIVYFYEADAGTGRVVYIADQDTNNLLELYSVPVEGGPFVKLNPPLVSGGNLYTFKIDPVSDRVVYSADQEMDDHFELYSVPITGGAAIKLNMPVSADIVFAFDITPGAAYVMFIAKPTGANSNQLYINDTAGDVVQRRSHDLNPGENVSGFQISPDGTQVVYNVMATGGGNLYQTSPFSGEAHILTTAEPGFGVNNYDFVFTPDGGYIVCLYQHDASSPLKLISVKTTGFPVVQADLYVPVNGHFVGLYQISPDSQWVVYEDYSPTLDLTLSAVPATGGNIVGFGLGADPAITPDSQCVVYTSLPEGNPNPIDLVSAQISGGDLLNLSQLSGFDVVYDQQISPDGRWVVFAVQLINGNGETIGTQLRASDEIEPPSVYYYTYIPLVHR
jgi:hypothetical protein